MDTFTDSIHDSFKMKTYYCIMRCLGWFDRLLDKPAPCMGETCLPRHTLSYLGIHYPTSVYTISIVCIHTFTLMPISIHLHENAINYQNGTGLKTNQASPRILWSFCKTYMYVGSSKPSKKNNAISVFFFFNSKPNGSSRECYNSPPVSFPNKILIQGVSDLYKHNLCALIKFVI